MKENREVSCLVTGSKAKLGVVVLVAAVSVDSPFTWALRHDEEPRAITTCVVQSAESAQVRVARAANSGSANTSPTVGKGTHVEVTTDEVDAVLVHVPFHRNLCRINSGKKKKCSCINK